VGLRHQKIFNAPDGDGVNYQRNDGLRIQSAPLEKSQNPTICSFLRWAKLIARSKFPEHEAGSSVSLISKPGCRQQPRHADYHLDEEDMLGASDLLVPMAMIVSLEEETTLEVWPGSHRVLRGEESKENYLHKQIVLGPGDVAFFRGDLVHGGAANNCFNQRVHLYLDSPAVQRKPNTTWLLSLADPEVRARFQD